MSASLALRGLLVVLAAVSLSLKVANGMVVVPLASDDLTQLAAALERGGFRIEASQQQNGFHLPIIKVARDDCRFLIAIVSAKGDQRAFLTQLAAPGEEVSFVYRGVILQETARALLPCSGWSPPRAVCSSMRVGTTSALSQQARRPFQDHQPY